MKEEKSKSMKEFDDELDETGSSPKPKKRTPKEMRDNPNDLLYPDGPEGISKTQRELDETWEVVTNGDPKHGANWKNDDPPGSQGREEPGSGANEGRGSHNSGIDDNGSGKKSSI